MTAMKILCGAAFLFCVSATSAAAQYRQDLPAVNTPPPAANPNAGNDFAKAAFASWYAKAGRPPILVFWNRELTDDATTEYEGRVTSVAGAASQTSGAAVAGWGVAASRGQASSVAISETTVGVNRVTDTQYANMNPAFSQGLESGFLSAFINAGGKMISREAMMRQVSRKVAKDERLDKQWMETEALNQGIKYLIEVLPNRNYNAATGMSVTIRVTYLPSAEVRAQFVTSGEPPKGPSRLVAGERGFERRAAVSTRTDDLVGAQLAYETMAKLR